MSRESESQKPPPTLCPRPDHRGGWPLLSLSRHVSWEPTLWLALWEARAALLGAALLEELGEVTCKQLWTIEPNECRRGGVLRGSAGESGDESSNGIPHGPICIEHFFAVSARWTLGK